MPFRVLHPLFTKVLLHFMATFKFVEKTPVGIAKILDGIENDTSLDELRQEAQLSSDSRSVRRQLNTSTNLSRRLATMDAVIDNDDRCGLLTGARAGARSRTTTSKFSRRHAMAQTKPPMPAPIITTFIVGRAIFDFGYCLWVVCPACKVGQVNVKAWRLCLM